jgi:hypothetical protein
MYYGQGNSVTLLTNGVIRRRNDYKQNIPGDHDTRVIKVRSKENSNTPGWNQPGETPAVVQALRPLSASQLEICWSASGLLI